jgi:hypothetical protein
VTRESPISRTAKIAATGLHDASNTRPMQVTPKMWPSLRMAVVGHRLTGLALAAVEQGRLQLTLRDQEELEALQRDAMTLAVLLERRLIEVDSALEAAGIEFVVLKGPAVAHTCYPDPALRPFSDLDLLVHRDDWSKTCDLLATLGYWRELPEPRPGFDSRFGKAVTFGSEEGSIDLHSTLASGAFGVWIDPDILFERTATLELGGAKLSRLDDTGLLLHACVHASLGWRPPLLLPLRDIVQMASTMRIDWPQLSELAGRWRLHPVLKHAFEATQRALDVALPAEVEPWLDRRLGRRERRTLEAYTTERRARGGMSLATFSALPGLRSKVAYSRSLLFPNRDFLRARADSGKRPSYFRRLTTPAGWMLGPRRDR